MSVLSGYASSVMAVCICVFITESICIRKTTPPSLSRGLSVISSLCIFITVLSPLIPTIKNIDTYDFEFEERNDPEYENYFLTLIEEQTENNIKELIYNNLGIELFSSDVKIVSHGDKTDIESITLILYKENESSLQSVKEVIKSAVGKETEVYINVNEY